MTVLITLTVAGANTGPFNLYSDVDGYLSAFETGVSKAALEAGYSSSLVPNAATTIRVMSTGVCTNYVDIPIVSTTTTTTSTSSTTTTTTTTGSVPTISDNYDVSTTQPEVCTSPVGLLLFSFSAFATGVILYVNNTLPLTPVTGYSYIKDPSSGMIYNLNPITGEVGASTGSSC